MTFKYFKMRSIIKYTPFHITIFPRIASNVEQWSFEVMLVGSINHVLRRGAFLMIVP